jgi:hypothetical protein
VRCNDEQLWLVRAIYIISVVSCLGRDVHKFYLRLVINRTPHKWRPVEGGKGHFLTSPVRSVQASLGYKGRIFTVSRPSFCY